MTPVTDFRSQILGLLQYGKHLTGKQIARALYPNEDPKKAYQRTMKQLKTLEKERLLDKKSYSLTAEYLWQIAKTKQTKERGFEAPGLIHKNLYEHTVAIGDVFVSLFADDLLQEWEVVLTTDQNEPDARAVYAGLTVFFEVEISEKGKSVLEDKINRYKKLWRQHATPFEVIYLFPNSDRVMNMTELFEETRVPYLAATQKDFIASPKDCPLFGRTKKFTLLGLAEKHFTA